MKRGTQLHCSPNSNFTWLHPLLHPPTQGVTHPPVRIVEEHFHNHQEHEEVEDGGGEGGQLVAALVAPPVDQGVGGEVEDGTNDEGV